MTGVFGYLSLGSHTPNVIISRETLDPNSKDFVMNFGVFLMITNMIVSTPLNLVVCRDQALRTLGLSMENRKIHAVASMFILFLQAILSCFFKDLLQCFSILGGFGGCFIAIFFPGLCMASILKVDRPKSSKIIAGVTWFLSIIGFIAAFMSLLSFVGYSF